MIDYTSAAKAADNYARIGGPDYGAVRNRRLSDPRFDHACHEALASQQEPVTGLEGPTAPVALTAVEKAAERARTAQETHTNTIEGQIRNNAWTARHPDGA